MDIVVVVGCEEPPEVARPTVMPIRAAPATTNMPLPPSSCAWRKPAGFPADKVAVGSAAQALDSSKADETIKGEMTERTFMKLLRTPHQGKAKEAESVPRQMFTLPRIKMVKFPDGVRQVYRAIRFAKCESCERR